MPDLQQELRSRLTGRIVIVGIGNTELGDDALGVRLAEALNRAGGVEVVIAGTVPENFVGKIAKGAFDNVLFLDAVEMGSGPGSVALMNAGEIRSRFPQISTHKFSLGTLAQIIATESKAQVWLLGVQPASLALAAPLSEPVKTTMALLGDLLVEILNDKGSLKPCCR
jgi:hydrogenase 3 maturation protease